MNKLLLIFVLFLLANTKQVQKLSRINLNDDWTLNIIDCPQDGRQITGKQFNTSIPTTLHLDLEYEKIIPDPFFSNHHERLNWISNCRVKYSKKFEIGLQTLAKPSVDLIFEGIDTYSTVKLNGNKLTETDNAFIQYRLKAKQFLKQGTNQIEVQLRPTTQYDQKMQRQNNMPYQYAQSRKACYQYGWDWAPKLVTMGIWRPVSLESYEQKINYVWVRNRMISKQKAVINFAVALNSQNTIDWWRNFNIVIKDKNNTILKTQKASDKNNYIDLQIEHPKLWWPNGIGEPYVYDFFVQLSIKDIVLHSMPVIYGIKTTQLNQLQNKFEVHINGHYVYCKGANYVPPDMFYPRLTNPRYKSTDKIKNLIQDAVDSGFNMIRLWGGGQYQSDEFFEECSRKGIMVFYDFMFSDSIYPSTQTFLTNVERQIKYQIRRARNYPCLTLWSGNNQILQGIQDWGWGQEKYKEDYRRLFELLIPKVIEYESPYIPYVPSSPSKGVGNYGFNRGGDAHFWGVWAGGQDFSAYESAVGFFNSQFGTQALPVWQTICQFTQQNDRAYQSPVLLSHEKHGSRFTTLEKYIKIHGVTALNFELETYQSGLIQAYGIEVAIKAQRCSKPKSAGTLYWQLNDAWPGISWSSIDYYSRWKPLQYMAKRLYPNIAIFVFNNKIHAINDNLYPVNAQAIIKIIDFNGTIIFEQKKILNLNQNANEQVMQVPRDKVQGKLEHVLLFTEIVAGRNQDMYSTHYFTKFNNLSLPQATLNVEYHEQFDQITLSSDKLIKNLYISNSKSYVKLSDNYFDLVPGNPIKVVIKSGQKLSEIKESMVYRSFRQISHNDQLTINVVAN